MNGYLPIIFLIAVQVNHALTQDDKPFSFASDLPPEALKGSIEAQSEEQEKILAMSNCTDKHDPYDISPCGPLPPWAQPPKRPIYSIRPVEGSTEFPWLNALKATIAAANRGDAEAKKQLDKMPTNFRMAEHMTEDELLAESRNVESPGKVLWDPREWYWVEQCPTKLRYVSSFQFGQKPHNQFWSHGPGQWYGRCYVIFPWNLQTVFEAKCLKKRCQDYCPYWSGYWWRIRNAICVPSCYKDFYVWIFCPYRYSHWKFNWCLINNRPWRCFRRYAFTLAQCCGCQQCWSMRATRTLKDPNVPFEEKLALFQSNENNGSGADDSGNGNDNGSSSNDHMPDESQLPGSSGEQ